MPDWKLQEILKKYSLCKEVNPDSNTSNAIILTKKRETRFHVSLRSNFHINLVDFLWTWFFKIKIFEKRRTQ
jgi:hypothetical protein